jgi:hypothetical protein
MLVSGEHSTVCVYWADVVVCFILALGDPPYTGRTEWNIK